MEPQIRFCTTADGVRIAYATLGQGPPLVHVPGWGYSLELDWKHREGHAWIERVARGRLLVSFDRRGVGASQREVDDLSLEAQVADVGAIADHLGLQRFDLLGGGTGAAVSVAYAAQHPERVSRLVLWTPNLRGRGIDSPATRSFAELMRGNWSVARRAMADTLVPSGPTELQRWLSGYFRQCVTPEVAAKYTELTAGMDVGPYLPQIKAPTLVLHRSDYREIPIAEARAAAALLPDARFVPLEGDVGIFYLGDTSYVETITRFLDEDRPREPAAETPEAGAFRTVLFTDVEGSTALTQRLGDAGAREVLREHERIVREALRSHGGAALKTMGDGFMASFGSAVKALECAIAMQRAFAEWNASLPARPEPVEGRAERQPPAHGSTGSPRAGGDVGATALAPLRVRIGLNAGEPIAEDEDLFGTAVIMAARIAAQAKGGEILASDVVRGLVAGKRFLFSDRGEVALRGFDEPVRLYECAGGRRDDGHRRL